MFAAIRRLVRSDDGVIADAEREAAGPFGDLPISHLAARHADVLSRAQSRGMDANTLLLLIQVFGPLVVKLIERWLARNP